jgi:hypothetical protein
MFETVLGWSLKDQPIFFNAEVDLMKNCYCLLILAMVSSFYPELSVFAGPNNYLYFNA